MLTRTNRQNIVGVFRNSADAQRAVRELRDAGFLDSQIGIVAKSGTGTAADSADSGTMAAEGAAVGVATGAGIGALWAVGIAANVLPVIGPVISGGFIAALLASAAGGAAIAGIVGALVGLGLSEEEATYYEGEVRSGRTLVTVQAGTQTDLAYDILERNNAYDINSSGETTNALDMPVAREDLSPTAAQLERRNF